MNDEEYREHIAKVNQEMEESWRAMDEPWIWRPVGCIAWFIVGSIIAMTVIGGCTYFIKEML